MTRVTALLLLAFIATRAWPASMLDAFTKGTAFGKSNNAATQANIKSGAAQSTLPYVSTGTAAANYFGSHGLAGPASVAVDACSAALLNPNAYDDQACRAMNFSQTNPAIRPQVAIGLADPAISRARGILNDPVANAGHIPSNYNFDKAYPADADFAKAVTLLEAQREAGKYLDPDALEMFKGADNRCRKKLFGLVNCCNKGGSDGSLFSNLNLILGAGGQVWGAVGSSYTYDALFTSDAPHLVLSGFEALFGVGGGSSALAGMLAGDLSVSSFIGSLVPGPWSIAMLAIQLSGILNCPQSEQVLAMKRDTRLCHGVGSYCSKKIPIIGTCLERMESYCCFNSRLARIIHEQGRAQLGRRWGDPKNPDCSGYSVAQLQSLDFARMDLSEFYAEIAPTLPDPAVLRAKVQQSVDSYIKK